MALFQNAFETLLAGKVDNPGERAVYLKNKGLALERLFRLSEAKTVFEQALKAAKKADAITENAIQETWAMLICQRGMRANDKGLLRQAIEIFEKSRERSDSLRLLLSSPGPRQHWLEGQFQVHASAMEAYFRLWQMTGERGLLEKAFALAERNKSIQLFTILLHINCNICSHYRTISF